MSSLAQSFLSGSFIMQDPVRQAFGLILYGGFLYHLSLPLDASDSFSEAYRPSETVQLLLSPEVRSTTPSGWCHMDVST